MFSFFCRKIVNKKNIWSRSRSWSWILKVSVSQGVVSISDGQVSVSVSDDEVETPSLVSISQFRLYPKSDPITGIALQNIGIYKVIRFLFLTHNTYLQNLYWSVNSQLWPLAYVYQTYNSINKSCVNENERYEINHI